MNLAKLLTGRKAPERRRYVELLHHFDGGNARSLALLDELRTKLGLSADQVAADFEVIAEVKRLNATLDHAEALELKMEVDAAQTAVTASFEASQRWQREWKESHGKLATELSNAQARQNAAHHARLDAQKRMGELDALRPDLHLPYEPNSAA